MRPRLDRLRAAELGRSRTALTRAIAAGGIAADGDTVTIVG